MEVTWTPFLNQKVIGLNAFKGYLRAFFEILPSYYILTQLKRFLADFVGHELVGKVFARNCVHNRRPFYAFM